MKLTDVHVSRKISINDDDDEIVFLSVSRFWSIFDDEQEDQISVKTRLIWLGFRRIIIDSFFSALLATSYIWLIWATRSMVYNNFWRFFVWKWHIDCHLYRLVVAHLMRPLFSSSLLSSTAERSTIDGSSFVVIWGLFCHGIIDVTGDSFSNSISNSVGYCL